MCLLEEIRNSCYDNYYQRKTYLSVIFLSAALQHSEQEEQKMNDHYFSKPIHTDGTPIDGLMAKEYEDPRDTAYLDALKLNKGFDRAAKLAIEYSIERINTVLYTGSNVRVTRENMPYLYGCVEKACKILNVEKMPEIFVKEDPYINASTTGSANPILVFNNSILHRLTHEELMFIIGHEVGHIKSEHLQYTLIGDALLRLGASFLDTSMLGSLITTGLNLAFYEWARRAEFTADHAGLLVCQDLHAAITALAKIGGYPLEYYDHLDANDFLTQAQQFTDFDDDLFNKLIKTYLVLGQTHPWTVLRARELMLWVQSGEYSRIVHRCSTWLQDEIDQLHTRANQADQTLEKARRNAENAANEYEESQQSAAQAQEDTQGKSGLQFLFAKGREGLKSLQAQLNESETDRRRENVLKARQEAEQARQQENTLRAMLHTVPEETIHLHTDATIGHLTRITRQDKA